jgi:hypothetical protein
MARELLERPEVVGPALARIADALAAELPIPAVSWSVHEPGNPSLAEGRAFTGRAVMGGIDHVGTLARGTPEDVLAQGRAVDLGHGQRGVPARAGLLGPARGTRGEPPGIRRERAVIMSA